jgi:hypothetical protein
VGIGFKAISPFQNIWKQLRNVTYIIMTLLLLFSAFAVMFRSGSDNKQSISIENYLPKIIIVMIVIQLSYAIAGFLIDIMYVSIMGIYLILQPVIGQDVAFKDFLSGHLFTSPVDLFWLILDSLGGLNNLFVHVQGTLYGYLATQLDL